MKRSETGSQLTWDLRFLFENQKAFEAQFTLVQKEIKLSQTTLSSLTDDRASSISFMEHQETLEHHLNNLTSYAEVSGDADPGNTQNQENLARSYTPYQQVDQALSNLPLLLTQSGEQIEQWLLEDSYRDFRYPIERVFCMISRQLSEEQEALFAQVGELTRNPQETFENSRLQLKPVLVDGKEESLNEGTYQQFLKNRDPRVHRGAFKHSFTAYKTYQNVFTNLLSGHVRGQISETGLRNFSNALGTSLFEDGVSRPLSDKVLLMTDEKCINGIHRYSAVRKQVSGFAAQHVYNIQTPLADAVGITYPVSESFNILKYILAPLGEDYVQLLDQARGECWVGFLPCAGK